MVLYYCMRILLLLFLSLIEMRMVYSQKGYPAPTNQKNLLFYIQHDRGQNTYVYKANLNPTKSFIKDDPILVYRQLFEEGGKVKPLTRIQKLFAYGIKYSEMDPNTYESYVVSLPDQKINISLDKDSVPIAETQVNGTKIILQRIFLKLTEGTSGLSTKLDYIIFYGRDKNGKSVEEKLIL